MEIHDLIVPVASVVRGLGLVITHTFIHEGEKVVVNYYSSEQSAQNLL